MVNASITRPGKRPRRALRRLPAALVASAALVVLALPGTAGAAHLSCGDAISGPVTLDSDLVGCPGDGLVVSGPTLVDLNGHVVSGSGSGAGIRVVGQNGVTIENGTIRGFEYGVWLEGGHDNRIGDAEGATVLEATGNWAGIYLSGEQRSQVVSAWVHDNSGTGITLGPTYEAGVDPVENELIGNRIENNGGPGIGITAGAGGKVHANRVVGNGRDGPAPGIVLGRSPNSDVRGNDVNDNAGDGISLRDSGTSLVHHNSVFGNGNHGIHVERSSSVTVVLNVAESNAGDGVRLIETGQAKLYENVLRANDQSGIHLLDSERNHLFRNVAQGNDIGFNLEGKLGVDRRDPFISTTRRNRLNRNTADANERFGILAMGAERTVIGNNDVHDSGLTGIYLIEGSSHVTVVNNEVFKNSPGIGVDFAPNARVDGNHVHHNTAGIVFSGRSEYQALDHARFEVGSNLVEENEGDGIFIAEGTRGKVDKEWWEDHSSAEISDPGGGRVSKHWVHDNRSNGNGDDGFDIMEPFTYLQENTANDNGDLGIEAVRGVGSVWNTASGNGDPRQCVNVTCS